MGRGIGPYKEQWRSHLFEKQGGLCHLCGKPMNYDSRRKNGDPGRTFPTFEHLQRVQDGGKTNGTNVVLMHRKCNQQTNREAQRRIGE